MENFKPIRGMKIKIYGRKATILYVRPNGHYLVGFDEPFGGHDGIYSDTVGYVPSTYSENNRCWMVDGNCSKGEEILTNELEVL